MTITEMTGEREVRLVVTPVMLLRHDVFDMKGDDIVLLMDTTIFARFPHGRVRVPWSWYPSTTHAAER